MAAAMAHYGEFGDTANKDRKTPFGEGKWPIKAIDVSVGHSGNGLSAKPIERERQRERFTCGTL